MADTVHKQTDVHTSFHYPPGLRHFFSFLAVKQCCHQHVLLQHLENSGCKMLFSPQPHFSHWLLVLVLYSVLGLALNIKAIDSKKIDVLFVKKGILTIIRILYDVVGYVNALLQNISFYQKLLS